MTITLNVSTAQEAFDAVVLQLSKQKVRAYVAASYDGVCLYRAPNAEPGNDRCAIGGLIPDDQYDPQIERLGIEDLIKGHKIKTTINSRLLGALQSAHDQRFNWYPQGGLNDDGWEDLACIARDYDLEFTRP